MWACTKLVALGLLILIAPIAFAQPGRGGGALSPAPPALPKPLYLPLPLSHPQGLGTITPRPLGYHVAPYGGLGYGPLGDRTGYPGVIYSTYHGSYLTPPPIPPLVLETPPNLALRPGRKLPTLDVLFPGVPPMLEPIVPRMSEPVPPGPVVPVSERK